MSVLRGVGALVESVTQFANHSLGDDTLAQIQAGLYVWTEMDWAAADSANTGGGVSEGQNPMSLIYQREGASVEYVNEEKGESTALATNAGWSKLKVTQGERPEDAQTWTDLEETEITDLFSGTVIIRIAAASTGDLSITKEVDTAENSEEAPADDSFAFTVELSDPENTEVGSETVPVDLTDDARQLGSVTGKEYSYTVTDKNGNSLVESGTITVQTNGSTNTITVAPSNPSQLVKADDETGQLLVTLKAEQTFTVKDLPAGTRYTVTETDKPWYTGNMAVTANDAAVTGSNGTYELAAGVNQVTVTNTYNKNGVIYGDDEGETYLNVHKTVTGEDGWDLAGNGFTFTMTGVSDDNGVAPPMPEGTQAGSGSTTITIGNDTPEHTSEFGPITFTEAGTYTYLIEEAVPARPVAGMTYDKTVYQLTITVTQSGGEERPPLKLEL